MDNRRVYHPIKMAMKQLYPTEPKGHQARRLTTLAALVAGIVQARSCQFARVDCRKTPDSPKRIAYEGHYLPFVMRSCWRI